LRENIHPVFLVWFFGVPSDAPDVVGIVAPPLPPLAVLSLTEAELEDDFIVELRLARPVAPPGRNGFETGGFDLISVPRRGVSVTSSSPDSSSDSSKGFFVTGGAYEFGRPPKPPPPNPVSLVGRKGLCPADMQARPT
jgi:hypothetical protein